MHAAEDSAPHGPNDPGAADFLAARRRYDAMKSELDEARSARDRTGLYLTCGRLGSARIGALAVAFRRTPRRTSRADKTGVWQGGCRVLAAVERPRRLLYIGGLTHPTSPTSPT